METDKKIPEGVSHRGEKEFAMKRQVWLWVIVVLFGFGGAAFGGDNRIPQNFQDQYAQATGSSAQLVKAIWFPIVPEWSPFNWDNILIISNFNNYTISVSCWFTTYSQEQTQKVYTLKFFDKKILKLDENGFGDELYDVYCASADLFGAAVLLLENGRIATAWPPIF